MIDDQIYLNVLHFIKDNYEDKNRCLDLIDSFSENQIKAKTKLVECVEMLGEFKEVAILGSWYGSILIPLLVDNADRITCFDLDKDVLGISKKIFANKKIDYICDDVFDRNMERYEEIDLIINTSCEHMRPMGEWPFWKPGVTFALQSNNMYGIEGHINCVDSIDEFEAQLPSRAKVMMREEIADSRGTRYLLVGTYL